VFQRALVNVIRVEYFKVLNPFPMQVLAPGQISGEIMTLMDEATRRMIIVSPYFNISQWQKLLHRLEAMQRRNIEVMCYVREHAVESIEEVQHAGLAPMVIEGLHTKLYMNDHCAIVSSMNLSEISDRHSLDIALKTENEQEYAQLLRYYSVYIAPAARSAGTVRLLTNWKEILDRRIKDATGDAATIEPTDSSLVINGRNIYEAFIANERGNDLRISGILSSREYAAAAKETRLFNKTAMDIELVRGVQGHYNMVWATQPGLKSWNIHSLRKEEEPVIAESIVQFICAVELFKKMVG
jgi:hypothetical protein